MRTLPLLLLSSLAAAPLLAQDQAPPVRFFIDGGYGQSDKTFDTNGKKISGADYSISTLRGGVSYDFKQIGDLGIGVDVTTSFADRQLRGAKSGFKPRDLGAMLHIEAPRYGLRAGYIQDFGPDFEAGSYTNSDNLNAVVVGANASTFFTPNLRVFGRADYFVTLKQDVTRTATVGGVTVGTKAETNTGDWLVGQAGVGFRPAEAIELGGRLAYHYQTGSDDNADGVGTAGEKTSNFSIIPFIHLNQPGSPFTFYAEGRSDREYGPVGYSLSGNNSVMGLTAVTVGLRYSFRADSQMRY